ncbi:hypothetical protein [Acinetobacter pittii]|uniref:hypothetical protein n=1 Tax=Acinetobacter pittii TaxID=48296 RepID=UPI00300CF8D4
MSAPKPKSKLDEVAEIIYKDTDNLVLTEFQTSRLLRMTREAESTNFVRAKKHRMMIYYLSGQYTKAKKELISLSPYAKKNIGLYIQLIAIAMRIGAFNEVSQISSQIDISTLITSSVGERKELLSNFGAPFCLIGDFEEGQNNMTRIENAMRDLDYEGFEDIFESSKKIFQVYQSLHLDQEKVKRLMEILEDIIALNKIRVLGAQISLPDNEVLIDLGINKPIENILKLNDELFDRAFDCNLTNELTALSINFTPIDLSQLKYAIY